MYRLSPIDQQAATLRLKWRAKPLYLLSTKQVESCLARGGVPIPTRHVAWHLHRLYHVHLCHQRTTHDDKAI
jgi:hypothetical protein